MESQPSRPPSAAPVRRDRREQPRTAVGGDARPDRQAAALAGGAGARGLDEIRPYIMQAGTLITAKKERRVLVLGNPGLRGKSQIT